MFDKGGCKRLFLLGHRVLESDDVVELMLAKQLGDIPIYVCPDRVKAASALIENHDIDMILADDAFQHRRLGRAKDIVVIDALEPANSYRALPVGMAREPFP